MGFYFLNTKRNIGCHIIHVPTIDTATLELSYYVAVFEGSLLILQLRSRYIRINIANLSSSSCFLSMSCFCEKIANLVGIPGVTTITLLEPV